MKRAFIMPSVIFLLVVFTLAAGSLMAGTTYFVKRMKQRVAYREQVTASEFGMKLAEDWLLSSISEGFIPKMAAAASGDALSRVAAVRPDGGRVPTDLSFDKFCLHLYVADTDYGDSMETEPKIPMIPESSVPGEGTTRCYFLRSTAEYGLWKSKLLCDELLAVSLDLSGRIQAVTRVFYAPDSTFK
jgi:hypothetical protein